MKFVFVKRSDGSVVDIPERDLGETLKRNPTWRIFKEESIVQSIVHQEVKPEIQAYNCPLCDFVGKNNQSLRMHKSKKHQ